MSDRDGKKTTTFLLSLKYGWYIKVVVIYYYKVYL